jgi:hypothetical protein
MSRRQTMIEEIAAEAAATADYTGLSAFDERVMAAMASVPRHEFVPPGEEAYAYINNALPIGHGQTISQPYIVALMTDLLDPQPDHSVLEIGTGSGGRDPLRAGATGLQYRSDSGAGAGGERTTAATWLSQRQRQERGRQCRLAGARAL